MAAVAPGAGLRESGKEKGNKKASLRALFVLVTSGVKQGNPVTWTRPLRFASVEEGIQEPREITWYLATGQKTGRLFRTYRALTRAARK